MDATYLQGFLSNAARVATRNEIRELLEVIARPDVISLAGGMPAPETFPVRQVVASLPEWIERHAGTAFQYGPTEGDRELRHELLRWLAREEGGRFSSLGLDALLVTSASQQALDLCGRVLVSPGEVVACGLPSYLGALGAFTACGARLAGVPLDASGLRADLLEQRLIELRRDGRRVKFVYVVPDFQNPSGVTMSLERRGELLAVAREFDLLVVEDSPYRQLRYAGRTLPSLFELDRDGRVVSLFTFSKILFPGLRLGWIVGHPEVVSRLTVAKQPVDLCSSGLGQLVAREYLKAGLLPAQIARVRELYRDRLAAMCAALERHFDPSWDVRWTRPEGGMFLWLTLPEGFDAAALLRRALDEQKVAFVIGSAFHCDGSGRNTLRLSFSYSDEREIDEAVARLARCIDAMRRDLPHAQETPVAPCTGVHSLEQMGWMLALSEVVE